MRCPYLDSAKLLARHTDHDEVMPVKFDLLADDTSISTKAPLPQAETEHGDRTRARSVLIVRGNRASLRCPHAQHFEVIAGDQLTLNTLCLLPRAQMESGGGINRQTGHQSVL